MWSINRIRIEWFVVAGQNDVIAQRNDALLILGFTLRGRYHLVSPEKPGEF